VRRVLMVDDEEDVGAALAMGLRRHGSEADAQSDPQKALREFRKRAYGTVILDVRMIPFDGFELYRRIVEIDPQARYFFLSAYHPNEFGSPPPQVKYLTKPIGISELISAITE